MLTLNTKIDPATLTTAVDGELILAYDQREKSRLRASLNSGEEVAVFTVRGTILRDGDLLRGDDGISAVGIDPGKHQARVKQRVPTPAAFIHQEGVRGNVQHARLPGRA